MVSILGFSQSYQFNKYSLDDGLPQQYVYSLNQDEKGFIWVGTGEGIAKFDGVEFKNYTTENGLAENFVACSDQKEKNTIWLGHNKGGISRIKNGVIETILKDSLVNSKITSISIDEDNFIWATSQNGYLVRIDSTLKVKKFKLFKEDVSLNVVCGKFNNHILIGTNEGLLIYKLNSKYEIKNYTEVKGLKNKNIQCITKSKYLNNQFWIGTAESGLYQIKFTKNANHKIRNSNNAFGIGSSNIKSIEEDASKNLLVSTFNGLYKLIYNTKTEGYSNTVHYTQFNGLSNYINTTLVDREGNTWVGMYGEGLSMLKDEIFVYYNHESDNIPNDTKSFLFQDSVKWFGMSEGLLKIAPKDEVKWKYYSNHNGFKNIAVTSIIGYGKYLFVATDGEGLYRFDTEREIFQKEYLVTSYLSNRIYDIEGHNNELYIATEGGLIIKNVVTGKTQHYNTLKGLKHNSIYEVEILKDKTLLLGSHSNELIYIKDGEISFELIEDLPQLMDIVNIDIDKDGSFWIATLGNGVFKKQDDKFIQISSIDGLKSDYCYSIVADNKNGVWVGHRGGLSRISKESLSVEIFDAKKGMSDDFNQNAVFVDKDENIWFGSHKRTVKFNANKYLKNTIPPLVSIKNIYLSDKKIPTYNDINVDYNSYKLEIEFIGISFKQPDKVNYQYYLEGYDLDWSESTSINKITYPRIDDGTYTFYVKACNNDGYCSDATKAFTITIDAPFWKKWWFILCCTILVIFIIYTIIKVREKAQKEIQQKLESELEKRTAEVVKKSEELEDKNKNITDSINYALRIQKSILPSKPLMKKHFPESFVFYKPRDIVSGDFYWYEKIGTKFIIACADCTGHGVPGAFMSMISSTLFKEIAHQYQITEPSNFLYKLDELLFSTLKKTKKDKIHDGLDLSVCVFDIETNELTFSGAYRPVLILQNGVLGRFKTNAYSIGGDDFGEKIFKTQTLKLNKGDIVYMFSDGYPDQFGGVKGKKLYLKGFESLIESIADQPMGEQHKLIGEFFENWKRDLKQIDDVLVIGVKII